MTETAKLQPALLEQIVALSGLRERPKLSHKGTTVEIVRFGDCAYKVRSYLTPEEANQQLRATQSAGDLFACCYGQVDRFLVLEYLDARNASEDECFVRLSSYLSNLASIEIDCSEDVLRDQFAQWLRFIEKHGMFTSETVALTARYNSLRSGTGIRWNLEHYDAMPRNFVCDGERFLSVDEKHLFVGPRGVSLIKPMWQLSQEVYAKLSAHYQKETQTPEINDSEYLEYLEFYYLVYSLAYNGRERSLGTNLATAQFHERREKLLRIIGAPASVRFREQFAWRTAHIGIKSYTRFRRMAGPYLRRFKNALDRNHVSNGEQLQPSISLNHKKIS